MNTLKYFFVCIASLIMLSSSCRDEDEQINNEKTVTFEALYSYSPGSSPTLTIDYSTVNLPLNIDVSNTTTDLSSNRVFLSFNNIKFKDNNGTYAVKSCETFEMDNGNWNLDSENFLRVDSSVNYGVSLVLDMSGSLGSDVQTVKNSAISFIDEMSQINNNCNIAVYGFSDTVYYSNYNSNFQAAKSFVTNLPEGANATRLYEAMALSYSPLINNYATTITSDPSKSYNVIVFTDGKNNDWSDLSYSDTVALSNLMHSYPFSSYIIGLKGKESNGINENVLGKLAINGGAAIFPENSSELNSLFKKFANSIGKTYTLVYDRNDSNTPAPIRLQFKIVLTKLESF